MTGLHPLNLTNPSPNQTAEFLETKSKYVITPILLSSFSAFLVHCKAANGAPVMVVGPTGAGKSLFLHTYQKFHENEQRLKGNRKPKTVWANCAHFGGENSDPNIVRAELFGQKKGSHHSAYSDKKGLVQIADGGVLILEEIGELPLEVQAMLLTFIETGEYREVGGSETKFATVKIVAATNREEVLRDDFRYRFFPFYIHPLYKQREDVLYYLAYKYPEITLNLTKLEVLKLLAYNWPGNIREIDRIARLMLREKIAADPMVFFDPEHVPADIHTYKLRNFDERETQIKAFSSAGILNEIALRGGDSRLLESLLNQFGVGLDVDDVEPAFSIDFDQSDSSSQVFSYLESTYDVKIFPPVEQFEKAYKGYQAFCGLFMQDPNKDKNIFNDLMNPDISYFEIGRFNVQKKDNKKLVQLVKAIIQYIKGVKIGNEDQMPEDLEQYWNEIVAQTSTQPEQEENEDPENQSQLNLDALLDMSEEQLRKAYYLGLLRKCKGNIKKASAKTGLKETTFRSRMDKLGIDYKRNNLN